MHQVCPCDWSLLPLTVFSAFTCVLFCHTCSDTCTQVFQESLGVLLTPQLVPSPQDCCAFQLVPVCTASTVEAKSRHVCCHQCQMCAAHITILASLGGHQLRLHSPKIEWRPTLVVTRVCKCGCKKVSSEQMLSHTNGFTGGCRH